MTWEIGFVQASLKDVSDAFFAWRRRLGRYELTRVQGDFPRLLCRLTPLTDAEPSRFLMLGTAGEWTAFFDNGAYGTDSFGPVSVLAGYMNTRGVKAVWVPDVDDSLPEQRGSIAWEVYGPDETEWLNLERAVAVILDEDRWTFDHAGTPFPFEELSAYEARRKRDRFTPTLLDSYLTAMGIRMFDDTFFAPDRRGILIEKPAVLPRGTREYPHEACSGERVPRGPWTRATARLS